MATVLAEVSHHRARFLARTDEGPIDIDLRLITAPLHARLHDLRGLRHSAPAVYDPAAYGAGQALGRALRDAGRFGVLHHSVRSPGGVRAGLFRPRALKPAREAAHIALHWDGARITHWYEKRAPQPVARPH